MDEKKLGVAAVWFLIGVAVWWVDQHVAWLLAGLWFAIFGVLKLNWSRAGLRIQQILDERRSR